MNKGKNFLLNISEEKINDLFLRINKTRYPDNTNEGSWKEGVELSWMQELVKYWKGEFNWKEQEALLNTFQQYKVSLNDLDLHYIYQKGQGENCIPLLLLHGWPGSIFEFIELIPILNNPKKYGINSNISFDVIVPSLPGYGLSFSKNQKRLGAKQVTDILVDFMKSNLGIDCFGVQGGDWGSMIGSRIAYKYPKNVLGLHLNFLASERSFFKKEANSSLEEINFYKEYKEWKKKEMGYYFIQGTKPQTLSYALSDSPVGLAAWISEKYHTWTDCNGYPERSISKDRMLSNICLYWFTESVGSSFWLYYDRHNGEWPISSSNPIVTPTGYAAFPKEIIKPPRSIANKNYSNIIRWTEMPSGGHFAALEEPMLLAEDICEFFSML